MHHIPESGGETVPDEEDPPLKPQPSPELTPELLLLICENKYISDRSNQLKRSLFKYYGIKSWYHGRISVHQPTVFFIAAALFLLLIAAATPPLPALMLSKDIAVRRLCFPPDRTEKTMPSSVIIS